MAILTESIELIKEVTGIFKQPDPTPAQQRAKAGVWYSMLQDFVINEPSSQELANRWRDQLPFQQKSTKQRFMQNNIIGRPYDVIVQNLVDKINDELVKGNFAPQSKTAILSGMGANSMISSAPAGQQPVDAGMPQPSPVDFGAVDDENGAESQMFFVIIGILILTAGAITWVFWKPKRRRR